ncbi:MAG: hypothetical protein CMI27_00550 [Opitutae bacterium]|nr:hypothetical protein [Opitutae bacterium]
MRLLFAQYFYLLFSLFGFCLHAEKPNIIFVLADDLGWAELGCYGNSFNETPHLDELAMQGMRFSQAYAAAPVCSPYRAALLTGQHPARVGILDYLRPNSSNALPVSQVTLPKMLKRNGYTTGMVGKWHLTGYKYQDAQFEVRPNDHGFDWNIGSEIKGVGNGANFWPYIFRTQPIRWLDIPNNRMGEKEYLTDRLNLEAVDFVERNQDKPFFLYLSHYAPHTILNGRPDLVNKYRKKHPPGKASRSKCYLCDDAGLTGEDCEYWAQDHNPHLAAMLESIDDGVGLLMKKLDSLGLSENTIFIFSSDNGGETNVTSNDPLRGGKSQLYEGGIRVPLIIRWPGGNIPSGVTCFQPVVNHDFYPTLLEAADIEPDPKQRLDGISNLATWRNASSVVSRDSLYWHYPLDKPHFLGGVSSGAIRSGDWKLIEFFDPARTDKFELFNLKNDPSEKKNLAVSKSKVLEKLKHDLKVWRENIGAQIPSRPLLVQTRNLLFGEHFSKGQVSQNWFFQKEWQVEEGVLVRNKVNGINKRIFYKDPNFQDALIRFDFQFNGAEDIRLVTGSNGSYNTVVHIRKDHFFIQTAYDSEGPWFPMRHDECAYNFEDEKWYGMTIEFIDDQAIAHLDHQYMVYAQHPVIKKNRNYFAFQVDQSGASFDNLQVFQAGPHPEQEKNLSLIKTRMDRFPHNKTVQEEHDILKRNLHALFFMKDEKYRDLINRVEELDKEKFEHFPNAFLTNKDFQKMIQDMRKELHQKDPEYKKILFSTFRAKQALDKYLVGKNPILSDLPDAKKKAVLEETRHQYKHNPEYQKLLKISEEAQQHLEEQYPQLFVSTEEISKKRKQARETVKNDLQFKQIVSDRSDAHSASIDYLYQNNSNLLQLKRVLDEQ